MRSTRAAIALAAVLLLAALTPATSSAAPGDLAFAGCDADTDVGGLCVDIPAAPLNDPREVVVNEAGTDLYVAGAEADAVSHFEIGADGRAAFADCVSNSGANDCTDLPGGPIEAADGLGISPDGRSLYVSSRAIDVVSQFSIAPSGALGFVACFSNAALAGCTDVPGTPIASPDDIAVSPDGDSVYVASGAGVGGIAHFTRNTTNGNLTFTSCVSDNGSGGACTDAPGAGFPLSGARAVDVSPDGGSVYVVSATSLVRFTAIGTGQLTWAGCFGDDTTHGCVDLPGAPINQGTDVLVSPDGDSVFAASRDAGGVVRFARDTTGALTPDSCVNNDGIVGFCDDAPGRPLSTVLGIALSPDGKDLYVAGFGGVARLAAGPTSGLDFGSCSSADGTGGVCTDLPGNLMFTGSAVAMGTNPGSVYTADLSSDGLLRFSRELEDTTAPRLSVTPVKGKAGRPVKVRVSCDEACTVDASGSAKPKGSKRGSLTSAEVQLAAGEESTLALRPSSRLKRKLKRAGKGRATVALTAADAAGNTSGATAKVKLK